jgi:helix-turn-helix protein
MKHANGVTEINKLTIPMKSPHQYIDDYKKIFSEVPIETGGENLTLVFENIKAEFVDEKDFEYRSITSVIHLTTPEPKGAQVTCNNLFLFEKGGYT